MIERAELCVQRNSTLNAGVMILASLSSSLSGMSRATSPHKSGRPLQQSRVRNFTSPRNAFTSAR